MELIKSENHWKEYKDRLSTSYGYNSATNNFDIIRKNSKAHNAFDNPITFPCIVSSFFHTIDEYHSEYNHDFLYLYDPEIEKMMSYKVKHNKLYKMKKNDLAIQLVDPDEVVRDMAKQIYEDKFK